MNILFKMHVYLKVKCISFAFVVECKCFFNTIEVQLVFCPTEIGLHEDVTSVLKNNQVSLLNIIVDIFLS